MHRLFVAILSAATLAVLSPAASAAEREPYGIALDGFAYPYPVHLLPLVNDGEQVRMAYMDVAPAQPNGRTVVLLHGRNFPSSYWAPVIKTLSEAGYRVVVPDQIGFGKSSKPLAELHFDTLARNTIALLDHLAIVKADIVAHSLGGMLGVRIARAYPDRVAHLVLTAPIGLEDYRLYVPPTPTEKILENEDKLTADGYRKQLEMNYALSDMLKLTSTTGLYRSSTKYRDTLNSATVRSARCAPRCHRRLRRPRWASCCAGWPRGHPAWTSTCRN